MTALIIPDGLEPLGAWGPHTPGWVDANVNDKIAWALEHIPRARDALRAEFYQLELGEHRAAFARVRYYARNASGSKYQDPATGVAALEPEPVIVPLDKLPLAHLLRAA